jgi:hypothetical protein
MKSNQICATYVKQLTTQEGLQELGEKKYKHISKLLLLALLCQVILPSLSYSKQVSALSYTTVNVDPNSVIDRNEFSMGFQIDGPDLYYWRTRSSLREPAYDMNFKMVRMWDTQIQPCTRWYESSKTGTWDWREVDQLVEQIIDIGAEPLIVLGFYHWDVDEILKPRGMSDNPNTGLPYTDSWAAYCAEWVEHFKEKGYPVKYYEIVNEPIFYFGWTADYTKLGHYVDLYNAAYNSMHAENPNVLLGTDGSIMRRVMEYFIEYGKPLGFLSYHAYGSDTLSASDQVLFNAAESRYQGETTNVLGVDEAVSLYKKERGIDLPVINSEYNVNSKFSSGTDPRTQKIEGGIYNALWIRTAMLKGYDYGIFFHWASSRSSESRKSTGGSGMGMVNLDDNDPWIPYYVYQMIGNNLDVGDQIISSSSSDTNVRVISWWHDGEIVTLLINKGTDEYRVTLQGLDGTLEYQKLDETTNWLSPSIKKGTIWESSGNHQVTLDGYTVMLLKGNADGGTPPLPPDPEPEPVGDLYDGFESASYDKWSGSVETSGENIYFRPNVVYKEDVSAFFGTNGGGGVENAYLYKDVNMDEVYVRGYFRLDNNLELDDNTDRYYFLRLRSNGQSIAGAGLRRENNQNYWIIYVRDGSGLAGPYYASAPNIQTNQWYSVELHWRKGSSNGLCELFIDGQRVLNQNYLDTDNLGNIDEVDFGLVSVRNINDDLVIYGDEAVISTEYVGLTDSTSPPPEPEPDPTPVNVFFEEDYESNNLNKWDDVLESSGESARTHSYAPYEGNFHGRFSNDGSSTSEYAYTNVDVNADEVYASGYFYPIQGTPLENNDDRFYFIRFQANGQSLAGAGIRRENGVDKWVIFSRDGTGWEGPEYASSPSIEDRWYNVELHWKKGSSNGLVELYVDGTKILQIDNVDTDNYGNVDSVNIGFISATSIQQDVIVYSDNIKLSTSFIGSES